MSNLLEKCIAAYVWDERPGVPWRLIPVILNGRVLTTEEREIEMSKKPLPSPTVVAVDGVVTEINLYFREPLDEPKPDFIIKSEADK